MSIFKANKYTKWYFGIISAAVSRVSNFASRKVANQTIGYVERHHIMPMSLGGSNDKKNLVWLTAREHYVCHLLLPKMVKSKDHCHRMLCALSYMCKRMSSHAYETFRIKHAAALSSLFSGVPKSRESIEKRRVAMKIKYENGYISHRRGVIRTKEEIQKQKTTVKIKQENGNYINSMKGKNRVDLIERNRQRLGSHWFNNGVEQQLLATCPDGWVQGMLPSTRKGVKRGCYKTAGKKWYNNGKINKLLSECPPGWMSGHIHLHAPAAKGIAIDGIYYSSKKEACNALGISRY